MSTLRRVLASIITFGLSRRLEHEAAIQQENIARVAVRAPRLDDEPDRDFSHAMEVAPFWRRHGKGRTR